MGLRATSSDPCSKGWILTERRMCRSREVLPTGSSSEIVQPGLLLFLLSPSLSSRSNPRRQQRPVRRSILRFSCSHHALVHLLSTTSLLSSDCPSPPAACAPSSDQAMVLLACARWANPPVCRPFWIALLSHAADDVAHIAGYWRARLDRRDPPQGPPGEEASFPLSVVPTCTLKHNKADRVRFFCLLATRSSTGRKGSHAPGLRHHVPSDVPAGPFLLVLLNTRCPNAIHDSLPFLAIRVCPLSL